MTGIDEFTGRSLVARWVSDVALVDNVRRYLQVSGWEEQPSGQAGALWNPPARLGRQVPAIAVPRHMEPGTLEWRGLIERLAAFEHKSQNDLALSVMTQYVDIFRLRAVNDYVISGTISLEAGAHLVRSAYDMLRAAGTTARRPRAQIGGNFSNIGDDVVRNARMGHTEEGSYIVPIWVPLTPPGPEEKNEPSLQGMEVERLPVETTERRVTRTLAQSLAAVREVIVRPEHAPRRASDLIPVVAAGGSRELVQALHRVLTQPAVTQFEARFSWAGGLASPGGVSQDVTLEAEAAPLLEDAARLLKVSVSFPRQIYTGQIVVITHRPGEEFGEVTVDTVRQNRNCDIVVRLDRQTLDLAYDWARNERAVLVEGKVTRGGPGRPLRIESPRQVMPLDETFLPDNSG